MKITLIKWWSDLLLKPSVDPLTPLFNCSMKENSELWVEFAISLGILKFVLSLVNFIHRPHFILGIWVTPTQYNTHSKSEQLLNAKSQTVISMNDKILDCNYLVQLNTAHGLNCNLGIENQSIYIMIHTALKIWYKRVFEPQRYIFIYLCQISNRFFENIKIR